MIRRALALSAAALLLAATPAHAQMKRLMEYGYGLADAKGIYGDEKVSFFVHPTEDVLLVQGKLLTVARQGFMKGATFGAYDPLSPLAKWQEAAGEFVAPLGCTVGDGIRLDAATSVEVAFTCPPGVDLRQALKDQRKRLRQGLSLTPPPPTG